MPRNDSLVPIAEAEFFVEALRAAGAPVEFLRIQSAQHAFDVLGGVRTRALAVRIERFLETTVSTSSIEPLPPDASNPDTA
jgi:acetyl esterase/lipase